MRQTDRDIRHKIADLMRLAAVLLLSAWTMLAVVSCGSGGGDDPGSPGTTPGGTTPVQPATDKPIAFSAIQQDEQTITRADDGLERFAPTFTVYGYKNMKYTTGSYGDLQTVFPGYTVNWVENSAYTTTSNSNGWEYVNQQTSGDEQTIKYWDWSARAYRFFGHTDLEQSGGTVGGNETTGPKTLSFTADATSTESINDAPYFSALWFSTGNPTYYSDRQFGQPVKLVFTKPFVKVRFMFISADPDNAPLDQMVLTDISFKPKDGALIETAGTMTISYPMTGTETRESFSVSGVTASLRALTEHDSWHTLLPAKNQGVYTLSVTVNGGEPRHVSVPAEYMDWQPGYEYTYVFKVFEEGGVSFGQVYTAYFDWNEDKSADYTFYNW